MLEKISNLNEEIKSEVKTYNNGWIGLGMKLLELSIEIEKNDKISWKTEFNVSHFSEYCAVILKEDYDKMIKIRIASKCLKNNRNELYKNYKNDNSVILPGFSLIYFVESNKSKLEEIGKYDELIDNLFEDKLTRFELDEKIRGYKKKKVDVVENNKDWTKDQTRLNVLTDAYTSLFTELTKDPNANIMVTGGKVCLHSELPRLGSLKFNKMYIHEVDKKIFRYLTSLYLPKYDVNNKALAFNRNIYTSNQINVSFISNDVHGGPQNSKKYIPIPHLPFLWARQVSMALINKNIKEVGMVLNTSVRGAGVEGYKHLINKASVLLKEALGIKLRKVFTVDKCYNSSMWTTSLIASGDVALNNKDLINFSNKIEKELTNEQPR